MIKTIYENFKDEDSYKSYILRNKINTPNTCPYCKNHKITFTSNYLFHCNLCNSNYSLTVNTIMHDTKIDLRKWLHSLYIFLENEQISYRKLSKELKVNKNTAYRLINQLYFLFSKKKLTILKTAGMNKDELEIMSLILFTRIK